MIILLFVIGIFAGTLAAFFGIAGGVLLLPVLSYLDFSLVNTVGVSSLCSFMSTTSATLFNVKIQRFLSAKRILTLMLPAVIFAQIGVYFVRVFSESIVLITYLLLLVILILLSSLSQVIDSEEFDINRYSKKDFYNSLFSGSFAGLCSGAFGIGGGVLLVPLQTYFLKVPIKMAINISSAVIIFTTLSSFVGHYLKGGVLIEEGLVLGIGGVIGANFGTKLLRKVESSNVRKYFILLLSLLIISILYKLNTLS